MLTGTYNFSGYNYSVEAYDFGDSIVAYLTPVTTKDKKFLDEGIHGRDFDIPAQWDKLYVKVGSGAVYASCYIFEDVDDDTGEKVKYKNTLNSRVLTRFGEILRGMKADCNNITKSTEELYDTFSPSRVETYKFPTGYMKLEVRTIKDVEYQSFDGDAYLRLEEDYSF